MKDGQLEQLKRGCEMKGHWSNGALVKLPYYLGRLDTIIYIFFQRTKNCEGKCWIFKEYIICQNEDYIN